MALYKETYRLSTILPGFSEIKEKLNLATGLKNEIEQLAENSVVFSNDIFKADIEVMIEPEDEYQNISLYFVPRRKKNYFEWALINVLNDYLHVKNKEIPLHAKKKWSDLSFFERHFK